MVNALFLEWIGCILLLYAYMLFPPHPQILSQAPLDKKHKKASIRPFDWMCMLRLSNQEMEESAFKDGIVSQVYDTMVKYLTLESHSIAFPELVFPATLQVGFVSVNQL